MAKICSKREAKTYFENYPKTIRTAAEGLWADYEKTLVVKTKIVSGAQAENQLKGLQEFEAATAKLSAFVLNRISNLASETSTFPPKSLAALKSALVDARDTTFAESQDSSALISAFKAFNASAFEALAYRYRSEVRGAFKLFQVAAPSYKDVLTKDFESTQLEGNAGAKFVEVGTALAKDYKKMLETAQSIKDECLSIKEPKGALKTIVKLKADTLVFLENGIVGIKKYAYIVEVAKALPDMRLRAVRTVAEALALVAKVDSQNDDVQKDLDSIKITLKTYLDRDPGEIEKRFPNVSENPVADFAALVKLCKLEFTSVSSQSAAIGTSLEKVEKALKLAESGLDDLKKLVIKDPAVTKRIDLARTKYTAIAALLKSMNADHAKAETLKVKMQAAIRKRVAMYESVGR